MKSYGIQIICNNIGVLCVLIVGIQALAAFPVGDLNRNFLVDIDDLVLFAQQWMLSPDCFGAPGCGDLEGDDTVSIEDFALVAQNWQQRGQITLVINELMASNDSTLEDPDEPGEYPDWIEIYNYGADTIQLSGMYLQDDNNLWQVPAGVSIQSGQYVLFWADDDDEQGDTHTTLKLDKDADEVTLLAYDGQTIVDTVSFAGQSNDISYGRYSDASDNWYTMETPSPGGSNNVGMAGEVYFSRLSGTFTSSFSLTLSTLSATAQIRYTTNGTIPTPSSFLYSGPITVNNTQARRIRARAYVSGLAPGPVTSHYYIPLAADAQGFTSNLPIVVIDTYSIGIDRTLRMVSSVFIDTDKDTGLADIKDIPEHAGRAGLKIRGESSDVWPKKHYALELWDENDTDSKASLFGMPSESDWTLNNPYGDKTLIRNILAYKWANDIGQGFAAPGTKLVEMFVNEGGGNCSYADYRGVYVLTEKIKVSENRLDIGNLAAGDNTEPEISGGYILRIDKDYSNIYEEFNTNANLVTNGEGQGFQYFDPDQFTLTAMQKNWIWSHFNEYESVLNSGTFNDPINGYAEYIDVESFIEFDLIAELFKEADNFNYSTYLYKEKNGKIIFGPQWDYNFSSGNASIFNPWSYPEYFARADTSEGWFNYYRPAYGWHRRLLTDNDYKLRTADKWFEHREDKLSDAQVAADIDYYYTLLDSDGPLVNTAGTPADRNFAKWNILNTYQWCNYYYGYNASRPEQGNLPHTYKMETEWLKNWFNGQGAPAAGERYLATHSDRLGHLDALWQSDRNICAPPTLSINGTPMNLGGQVDIGDILTISASCPGIIYYTTDGTDPRTWTISNSVPPFNTVLVAEGAAKAVLIPSGPVSDDWKGGNEPFDDSNWNNYTFVPGKPGSVGYENSSGYEYLISYDVKSYLLGNNNTQSCLIRIPFTVDAGQLSDMTYLTLRMRYDDAFVAYINGIEVYRSPLVPEPLLWSSASTDFADPDATNLVDYDISGHLGPLQSGNNILTIHALNSGSTSSDFLISIQLEAGAVGSGGITSGGAISPAAVPYTSPVTLTRSECIKARLKNGANWGALNKAYYSVGPVADNLRITEIMYHPADPNHEFVEVQNIGTTAVNLAWVKFTDGIDFTFPDISLGAGQYAVVVRNQAAFEALYGTGITVAGQFTGALDNGGEEIVLRDAFGAEILDFDYSDDWYPVTDGAGFSLNIINSSDPDPNHWDEKDAWQASSVIHGSPGAANPPNVVPNEAIVINEVLTHSNSYPNDWIELHNTTGSAVVIGGWFLSDDRDNLKKYRIAAGQSIPPYGYKVFTEDDNFGALSTDPGRLAGFGLSEVGEEVCLSSGTGGNLAGGYSVWEEFEAAEPEISFGRYVKSAAAGYDVDFVAMQSRTYQAANTTGPLVEGVVITEIMYNPAVIQDQLGEYIELKNRTASAIGLFDAANPSNTWKFTKGVDFTFPLGVSIPAGGRILVVRTDPDIFRFLHPAVPGGAAVYGPFVDSELENDGEKIELSRPTAPEPGGFVPYVRVEQVNYSDGIHPLGDDPWPASADGRGDSLHRITASDYANDVANWSAGTPTPGS
jgi:hypothetical protein